MATRKISAQSESSKKSQSDKMKAHWSDPAYRTKSVVAFSKRVNPWDDPVVGPAMRQAARDRMTKRMQSPEAKERASTRITEFNKTPMARLLRSTNSSANWRNVDTRERMVSGMVATKARALKVAPPTEFEARCYLFLDECGAVYIRQHPIMEAQTILDAYVPDRKLCIYFDSEYWHSMPQNAERDVRQRAKLESLGYAVLSIRSDHKAREINAADLEAVRQFLCRA